MCAAELVQHDRAPLQSKQGIVDVHASTQSIVAADRADHSGSKTFSQFTGYRAGDLGEEIPHHLGRIIPARILEIHKTPLPGGSYRIVETEIGSRDAAPRRLERTGAVCGVVSEILDNAAPQRNRFGSHEIADLWVFRIDEGPQPAIHTGDMSLAIEVCFRGRG